MALPRPVQVSQRKTRWPGNISLNSASGCRSADGTYVDHTVDVLVAVAVAHYQVEGFGVCVDGWLWRGELKPQGLIDVKVKTCYDTPDNIRLVCKQIAALTRPTQPLSLVTFRACKRKKKLQTQRLYLFKALWSVFFFFFTL